jgi:ATP phosphoribosyltransferase regulatory subunit
MNDALHPALLPLGFRDLLPPEASSEAEVVEKAMAVLAAHGYERVKPPLIEFAESLLSGPGAAMTNETFRLMDPTSQRMIGLRADITPQVARIAATRLRAVPRPLRLCYSGQVLRAAGSQRRPARQVGQVGAELIGADGTAADVEAIALAAEALLAVGVGELSVDLTIPRLVPAICDALAVPAGAAEAIRAALDHKDAAQLAAIGGAAAPLLGRLLAAAGNAEKALARLTALDLPEAARAERDRVASVTKLLHARLPQLGITIDPVENRGFEYQTGISFTFFNRRLRDELARGGRYLAGGEAPEPATGFTLFTETVLEAVPTPASARRLYLPAGTAPAVAAALRAEAWVTVDGLDPVADPAAEARRLRCTHLLADGKPRPAKLDAG